MFTTFPWRTLVLALLCALTGLALGVFMLAGGGTVSALPDAVLDGLDSATGEGLRNAVILAAGALLAGELLALVIGLHTTSLYRASR